jgi:hypothetical protein
MTAISKLALSQERWASLDVFRGVTIALMILINNLGGNEYYTFLQHADWNGWTLADLVFPFFLFIVGVAIPYAFTDKLEKVQTEEDCLSAPHTEQPHSSLWVFLSATSLISTYQHSE